MSLTKEQIQANAIKSSLHKEHVPEWGSEVYIKKLGAAERLALAEALARSMKLVEYDSVIVQHCLADETGARIYGEDDLAAVMALPDYAVIERLARIVDKINLLKEEAVEELEKN